MIEAMLMLISPDKDGIEGLGLHQFRLAPRLSEHVTREVDGVGEVYKVVAVHHPDRPASAVCDIYVVHVGNLLEHLRELRQIAQIGVSYCAAAKEAELSVAADEAAAGLATERSC